MNARECILMIVTGQKGVGKSHETLKELIYYVVGDKTTGAYPRKVLIFDINDEYGNYRFDIYGSDPEVVEMLKNPDIYQLMEGRQSIKIKALAAEDVAKFSAHPCVEIRRIRPFHTETKYMIKGKKKVLLWKRGEAWTPDQATAILTQVLQNFRGGRLHIEDLSSVFGDSINKTVSGLITRNRHRDLDITMHLQSVSPILPRFWQNVQVTRYHEQIDPIEKSKSKLSGFYVMYKIVEKLVSKRYDSGDKRYFVFVYNGEHKIKGDYSEIELQEAIQEYLLSNPTELKELNNLRTLTGQKVNNYETSLRIKTDKYVKYYSQFYE